MDFKLNSLSSDTILEYFIFESKILKIGRSGPLMTLIHKNILFLIFFQFRNEIP